MSNINELKAGCIYSASRQSYVNFTYSGDVCVGSIETQSRLFISYVDSDYIIETASTDIYFLILSISSFDYCV